MNEDEIYCIPTYMKTQRVKDYTRNLINFLKKENKQVLLISHYLIPTEFQEIVDFCIYDNRNTLLFDSKYKGWLFYLCQTFSVYSKDFFSYNSSLACYYFHSALFLAKFANKKIIHFIDYDTILSNLDVYNDNYKILKNTDFSSVRFKHNNGDFFADTTSLDLTKIKIENYIISDEEFKKLIETHKRFEELFCAHFLQFENPYWKNKSELDLSTQSGLEHINSIDWICVASDEQEDKLWLIIINPENNKLKKYKIIIDGHISNQVLNTGWWAKEVTNCKMVIIYDDKNIILKTYIISEINISENRIDNRISFTRK